MYIAMSGGADPFVPIQVFRCRCAMLRGDDQFEGHLSLDDRFLFFRSVPAGPESRPIAWELPRTAIDQVRLSDDEFFLDLEVGPINHRFRGIGLEPIYQELRSSSAGADTSGPGGDDDDAALLEGAINLFVNAMLSARGRVTVTNSKLSFRSSSELEKGLWKDLDRDIPINDISSVEMVGIRRKLVVTTRGEQLAFGGALASRLYGVLLAVRGDTVTIMGRNHVVFTWTVSLQRGPINVAGELVGSARRIRFVPSGRIDALFGLDRKLELQLYELSRVEVRGRVDKRLVLTAGQEEFSFEVDDPNERLEDLKDFLLEIEHEFEPDISRDGTSIRNDSIDELIETWQARLRFLDPAQMALIGAVLDLSRPGRARRGWLAIYDRKGLFLPIGEPSSGQVPLVIDVDDISRAAQGTAPPEHLHLGISGTTLRFLPRGGDRFAERFWSLWQPLVEAATATRRKAIREPSRGYGDAQSFNRRDAYRASLPSSAYCSVRETEGAEEPLSSLFVDLGPEGCAVVLDRALEADCQVQVQLPDWLMGEQEDPQITAETSTTIAVPCGPVPGRVIYSTVLRGGRVRHGICFEGLDHKQDLWVRELYMFLQREEVARERAETPIQIP